MEFKQTVHSLPLSPAGSASPRTCSARRWPRLRLRLRLLRCTVTAPRRPTLPSFSSSSSDSLPDYSSFACEERPTSIGCPDCCPSSPSPRLLGIGNSQCRGPHLIGSRGSHSVARFCPQLQLKRRKSCYWGIELECVSVLEPRFKVRYCQTARQLIKAKDAISHLLVEN